MFVKCKCKCEAVAGSFGPQRCSERERCVLRPTVCHFACTLCIQYFLCSPSFRVSLSLYSPSLFRFRLTLSNKEKHKEMITLLSHSNDIISYVCGHPFMYSSVCVCVGVTFAYGLFNLKFISRRCVHWRRTLLALSSYEFPLAHKTMQQFVVYCRQ